MSQSKQTSQTTIVDIDAEQAKYKRDQQYLKYMRLARAKEKLAIKTGRKPAAQNDTDAVKRIEQTASKRMKKDKLSLDEKEWADFTDKEVTEKNMNAAFDRMLNRITGDDSEFDAEDFENLSKYLIGSIRIFFQRYFDCDSMTGKELLAGIRMAKQQLEGQEIMGFAVEIGWLFIAHAHFWPKYSAETSNDAWMAGTENVTRLGKDTIVLFIRMGGVRVLSDSTNKHYLLAVQKWIKYNPEDDKEWLEQAKEEGKVPKMVVDSLHSVLPTESPMTRKQKKKKKYQAKKKAKDDEKKKKPVEGKVKTSHGCIAERDVLIADPVKSQPDSHGGARDDAYYEQRVTALLGGRTLEIVADHTYPFRGVTELNLD